MRLAGRPYLPASRDDAQRHGIHLVMQDLNLIGTLTVAENLFLRDLPRRLGFIRYDLIIPEARRLLQRIGMDEIEPTARVGSLGVGRQQMVEIASSLIGESRLLILDEPTAMLTGRETGLLYEQIHRLKGQGTGIIYISHRLEEIKQIADRITVLRDGQVVGVKEVDQVAIDEIVRLMVGRELEAPGAGAGRRIGEVVLEVEALSRGDKVREVGFQVRSGEILGFAGLVGSGRTETMRLIFGADRAERGTIRLHGRPLDLRSPADAVRHGIAMVTEDRKGEGLLLPHPVRVNITLSRLGDVASAGWIDRGKERSVARRVGERLSLRARSVDQPVSELSGGNQQKVVIGRWLHSDSEVMIFDEPTRGIDVGAKFEIYKLIADLAERGKAVLAVSSDLKELMLICDRIAVLSAGKLVRVFERGEWTQEEILSAAFSEYMAKNNDGKKQ